MLDFFYHRGSCWLQHWLSFGCVCLLAAGLTAAALLPCGGEIFLRSTFAADYHTEVVPMAGKVAAAQGILLGLGFLGTLYSYRHRLSLFRFLHPLLLLGSVSVLVQAFLSRGDSYDKHLLFLLAGAVLLAGMAVAGTVQPGKRACLLLFGVQVFLTLLVLLFGATHGGNCSWVSLFGVSFQPGELQKALVLLSFAVSYPHLEAEGRMLAAYLASSGIVVLGLLLGHDVGNAAVVGVLLLVTLLCFRPRVGLPLVGGGAALGACALLLSAKVRSRFFMVAQVMASPDTESYGQLRRFLLGLLRGGLLGTGTADGCYTPVTYVKNAPDDFALLTMLSIFGAAGGVFLLMLLFGLVRESLRDGESPRLLMTRGLCAVLLLVQAATHVGATLNLIPFTGMTFPLLSTGGSAILSTCAVCGVMLSTAMPETLFTAANRAASAAEERVEPWLDRLEERVRDAQERLASAMYEEEEDDDDDEGWE